MGNLHICGGTTSEHVAGVKFKMSEYLQKKKNKVNQLEN